MIDYGYTARFFTDGKEMDRWISDSGYGLDEDKPYLCLGVSFLEEGVDGNRYAYALHFNTSGRPGTGEVPATDFPRTDPIKSMN